MGHRRALFATSAVLLVTLALAVACAGPGAPAAKPAAQQPAAAGKAASGDATRGRDLFAQNCVSCHGPDAKGLPGLGKDMTTSAFIKGQSDQQLLDFVKKGRPVSDPANTTKVDMPPKGGNPALTDAQIRDIIAHIRSLQR
jgi:disulfide bond formation protein DsbB